MPKTVVIDCFPESAARYVDDHVIVAVDVIRATTTATTAVALGRRCFPVPSLEAALPLAARLDNPLIVGEPGGASGLGRCLKADDPPLDVLHETHHGCPRVAGRLYRIPARALGPRGTSRWRARADSSHRR